MSSRNPRPTRFLILIIVLTSCLSTLLLDIDRKSHAQVADLLEPTTSYSFRTNNIGVDADVFKLSSKPLVHSLFGNNLTIAERESPRLRLFKIVGGKLRFHSQLSIVFRLDSILILDLWQSDTETIYVSLVDFSKTVGSCGITKVLRIRNFKTQEVIFESLPCLSGVVAWSEVAGRLASNEQSIFMTGGNIFLDLYRNVFPRPELCCNLPATYTKAMATTNLYGGVVEIDKLSKRAKKIATGLRGPQGLAWDSYRGKLWETEHGPQGGDELNSIIQGRNYGWPFVTYGIPYNQSDTELDQNLPKRTKYGIHEGYEEPTWYWTPSIAPSQLVVIMKTSPFWRYFANDLLVSTLKDKSLQRMSLSRSGRVQSVERIEIGLRIRDLSSSNVGIVLSSDSGEIVVLTPNPDIDLLGPFPPVN